MQKKSAITSRMRLLTICIALLCLIVVMTACGKSATSGEQGAVASAEPTTSELPTAAPTDPVASDSPTATPEQSPSSSSSNGSNMEVDPAIAEQINQMTTDQKIGQLLLVGMNGTTANAAVAEMIEKYHVGGFILYKDNMHNAEQIRGLLNDLKQINQRSDQPALWLSLDQEGGKVSRLPSEYLSFPTARSIGSSNQIEYTTAIGEAIGQAVASLGFNMNYAPVLDVDSNPKNPVIGNRSYGSDPQTVSTHGIATMKSLQKSKVVPVVKHFPGHGDTYVDSHLSLPVVHKSLEELHELELLPFIDAIASGTDAIMIAHLLLPAIDDTLPASLSPAVVTDLLRTELGYTGVIMTDDLTMGGIVKHRTVPQAAVEAFLAGNDILLIGHQPKQQQAAFAELSDAVASGKISMDRLDASVARILQLKADYTLSDTAIEAVDIEAVNEHTQQAKSLYNP